MQSRYTRRFWGISLFAVFLLGVQMAVFSSATVGTANWAQAQEEEEGVAEGDEETTESGSDEEGQSALVWLYNALGIRYVVVFLFLTFNLVALFVMNVLAVRRENIMPSILLQGFEGHLNEKRYQEAYELAKNDDSFLGRVLAAGMQQLSSGYSSAIEAMQEAGEEENMKMEHRLGYVALIAQIGPMFGLLGTVDGMVTAFTKIAAANTTPKPSVLAGGISRALMTTLIGLCVAIPALVYYQIVRNRLNRLVLEVGIVTSELMKRFENVPAGGKKA